MNKTISAWLIWFAGIGFLIGIDYLGRMKNWSILTGGFGEIITFVVLYVLGIISAYLLFDGMNKLPIWLRLLLTVIQIAVGILLTGWVFVYYSCSIWKDCF